MLMTVIMEFQIAQRYECAVQVQLIANLLVYYSNCAIVPAQYWSTLY